MRYASVVLKLPIKCVLVLLTNKRSILVIIILQLDLVYEFTGTSDILSFLLGRAPELRSILVILAPLR